MHSIKLFAITTCFTSMLTATGASAAPVCKQFEFIYQQAFILGDGEGMQTLSCKEENYAVGDATYKKMQGLLNAGQHDQARKELDRVLTVNNNVEYGKYRPAEELCVRASLNKPFETLMQQIGKKRAAAHERNLKYQDAINTDINYCLYDEAARLHLMLAEKHISDASELKKAHAFGKQYNNKAYREKVQSIANARAKNHTDNENKFFSNQSYNPTPLSSAIDIYEAVENTAGKNRIKKIAETRGDTLAKSDSCRLLSYANDYYEIADQNNKIKAIQARAIIIGDTMEKQKNPRAAATCFEVAGNDSKAEKLLNAAEANAEKAEAAKQKAEPARKDKFNKEQDDLEKELGL